MDEFEIRPDQYKKTIDCYSLEDKKRLLERKDDFVHVCCPACCKTDSKFAFMKMEIRYLECNICKTVYASPRPTSEILKDYYQNSQNYRFWNKHIFPASENARLEKIVKPRVDLLLEYCERYNTRRDTLIDVGAGFGTFCKEVRDRSVFKRVIGVEPNPELAHRCREKKIEVIEKSFEEIEPEEIQGDVIVSFEAIEHMYSPRDFIHSCVNLLTESGLLILSCPNMLGFDTMVLQSVSRSVGGEHINMFNPDSIRMLLDDCGLKVLRLKTPGKLDAELVRKSALAGEFDINNQAFLKYILIDRWEETGRNFQKFLADNLLSSHMIAIAMKH